MLALALRYIPVGGTDMRFFRFSPKANSIASRFLIGFAMASITGEALQNCGGNNAGAAQSVSASETGVAIQQATAAQCSQGGIVVVVFDDTNGNGQLDPGEEIVSENVICNGAQGQGAGIQVAQASTNSCPAGGIVITTFIDSKNDGTLDPGDKITSTNAVCNGVTGATGETGNSFSVSQTPASAAQCPAGGYVYTIQELNGNGAAILNSASVSIVCNGLTGASGASLVFTTVPASSAACPTDGNVLLIASDTAGTGVYNAADLNQRSVLICNGPTGAQGPAGPVSAFSPVTPIMPCGADSSPNKEVLLCLANGDILADFSAEMSGDATRLSFIPPGTYEDTDSSGCVFNVTSEASGGLSVSWQAGSNQYGSWNAGAVDCMGGG